MICSRLFLEHVVHHDAGGVYSFGGDCAYRHGFLGLNDDQVCCRSHHRVEVLRSAVVDQVALLVSYACADESHVSAEGLLEEVVLAVHVDDLLALGHDSSESCGCEEAAEAAARAAGLSVAVEDASLPLTEVSLAALLDGAFPTDAIETAMTAIAMHGGENVTRAEAAVFFDRLFSLPAADTETAFYPDVIPGEWGSGDIYTAADGAAVWDGPDGRPAEGPVLIDSQLYYAGADGYFLKNAYAGSHYFDAAGRYTSGNAELDGYVLAALREATDDSMTRDEMLRAMYLYVRDSFTYLRRHYYKTGDVGWATQEALTMYSTGRGNCYCYAGAFCALARGLGYNARTYSGSIGIENQPHAWTEITLDGKIYICDPEIEMNYWLLKMYTDNFMMLRENSLGWNYQAVGRT